MTNQPPSIPDYDNFFMTEERLSNGFIEGDEVRCSTVVADFQVYLEGCDLSPHADVEAWAVGCRANVSELIKLLNPDDTVALPTVSTPCKELPHKKEK